MRSTNVLRHPNGLAIKKIAQALIESLAYLYKQSTLFASKFSIVAHNFNSQTLLRLFFWFSAFLCYFTKHSLL